MGLQKFGEIRGGKRFQSVESPGGEADSEEAADRRQQSCFREQLRDQPAATRAHRRADRHFGLARAGAGQHQVRNICARDQEKETDGAELLSSVILVLEARRNLIR